MLYTTSKAPVTTSVAPVTSSDALVTSSFLLLLVVRPRAPSSFLLLVRMLLVAMPGAMPFVPSSVLAPRVGSERSGLQTHGLLV